MNSPCSTIAGDPGKGLCQALGIGRSRRANSRECNAPRRSQTAWLRPASRIGPASRNSASAPSMCLRVAARPKGTTSTGNGKAPSRRTSFVSSAITAIRWEAAATIFSRSKAPPPPLISLSSRSISSAPSTVRSSSGTSSSVASGMPSAFAWAAVASDVATQRTSSPSATFSPTRSTKWRAVEPEPSPSLMPGSTSSVARRAASCFCRSISALAVIAVVPLAFLGVGDPRTATRATETHGSERDRAARLRGSAVALAAHTIQSKSRPRAPTFARPRSRPRNFATRWSGR